MVIPLGNDDARGDHGLASEDGISMVVAAFWHGPRHTVVRCTNAINVLCDQQAVEWSAVKPRTELSLKQLILARLMLCQHC